MAKEYYSITTKKFQLKTNHSGWLETTRNLYNEILGFYYGLFLAHDETHDMNSQNAMRALEQLTIVGRDKKPVPEPLPWNKVPLYFRRAAINEAIAAGKSYLSRKEGNHTQDIPTKKFLSGVTFYKGMYEDLTSTSVSLKVYNGEKWKWLHCRLSGNAFLETEEYMSPKLVFTKQGTELHVPVRSHVLDGRKLKERIDEDLRICSLQFMHRDTLALCCVMDIQGTLCHVQFLRGGANYEARCKVILDKIQTSQLSVGEKRVKGSNQKHWQKLKNISDDMAHQISRRILEICESQKVSVIVLPRYSKRYSKLVMHASGEWSSLRLSHRIIEQLQYKAWKQGILVVEVEASNIGSVCAVCSAPIHKKGEEFECSNGHKGNRHLNSARNLGMKFLKNMGKVMP